MHSLIYGIYIKDINDREREAKQWFQITEAKMPKKINGGSKKEEDQEADMALDSFMVQGEELYIYIKLQIQYYMGTNLQ